VRRLPTFMDKVFCAMFYRSLVVRLFFFFRLLNYLSFSR